MIFKKLNLLLTIKIENISTIHEFFLSNQITKLELLKITSNLTSKYKKELSNKNYLKNSSDKDIQL